MAQELSQTQVQSEVQVLAQNMTPQQLLLVKLTEMSVNELEKRVEEELLDNSALEEAPIDDPDFHEDTEYSGDASNNDEHEDDGDFHEQDGLKDMEMRDEGSYGEYGGDDDFPDYLTQSTYKSSEQVVLPIGEQESFYDSLLSQIGEHDISEKQRVLLEYLVGSLDSDGLLRKPLTMIYYELMTKENVETSLDELEEALKILQRFEPIGIGATSLKDCLLTQLNCKDKNDPDVVEAKKILTKHFDDFINKRYDRLKHLHHLSEEAFDRIIHLLCHLNPRPGSGMTDTVSGQAQVIIPDFTVTQDDNGNFDVSLNQGDIPVLRVSESFRVSLAEYENNKKNLSRDQQDTVVFMKQKVTAARNFINAIAQRRDTLLRTMSTIVQLQKPFFEEGTVESLQPMILEDVAKKTGLDRSTISRVSKSKYVNTDFGVFPLRYFFNEKFTTSSGDNFSKMHARNKLREIIDTENKKKPLSDDEITEMMKAAGFPVARRTITKYREKMKIPSARLRRQ